MATALATETGRSAGMCDDSPPTLEWVPEKERAPRSPWNGLKPVPFGWCRFCGDPIVIRDGQKTTGPCRSLADMAGGCQIYRRAHWHPPCKATFAEYDGSVWAWHRLREGRGCESCGRDLVAIQKRIDSIRKRSRYNRVGYGYDAAGGWGYMPRNEPLRRALRNMGLSDELTRSLGECDHIVPLWAGGKNHPNNFQLLCHRCHKIKTKWEAGERGRAKKRWNHRRLGFGN